VAPAVLQRTRSDQSCGVRLTIVAVGGRGGVLVQQSFRPRQGTGGGRFVIRILGTSSADFFACRAAGRFSAQP
jgi:hypothetical protein